jgi:hypothetical protein
MPKPFMSLILLLYRLPLLRHRLRPGALEELQPEHRAVQLENWKEWAQAYLAKPQAP